MLKTIFFLFFQLNMPVVDMWRPDVVLLNTAGQMLNFQQKADFYANVNHNGDVYWAPSITTKSICEVSITGEISQPFGS